MMDVPASEAPLPRGSSVVSSKPESPSAISELKSQQTERPRISGKYIFVGKKKLWVCGVTYGTFRPDADGVQFPSREIVDQDFKAMAENGLNALRVYTPPPLWLLDIAQRHALRVMVGLPWEQHIAFLDNSKTVKRIFASVRAGVKTCAGHPAVLCYAIGNEIPAQIVRFYGKKRIERFLKRLFLEAKMEDPEGLFTYVNFPSTEYLELPFLDIFAFNVYLESEDRLSAYLARLQNRAGIRPLLLAELGLDSSRNGEDKQAEVLDWQIRTTFEAGSCGAFVFAWTDEWYRGGHDIDDWDFGLTTRSRQAKPALSTVAHAFSQVPFDQNRTWPMISVIVCSYNGASTIRDTLEGLEKLKYPNFEVVVVDDGSTDATAAIAKEYNVHLLSTDNYGLSSARNAGLAAAKGEIVAYIDDDAYPDPDWLAFLAAGFVSSDHAAIGGPNIAPAGDGPIAECIANAPGGPVHVLLSDDVAEHIPGCNLAVRKDRLEAIGGFDSQFRAAGDDVDVCWRLQDQGWSLGFCPGAMNWHHRRNSIFSYYRQQLGYGKAEAMLEKKWPEKYNRLGHLRWPGRLYGPGLIEPIFRRQRIYHGMWGGAPFQRLYLGAPEGFFSFVMTPEWYMLIAILGFVVALSVFWAPLIILLPVLIVTVGAALVQAAAGGIRASFHAEPQTLVDDFKRRSLTAFLHLIQPLARLRGRLQNGLTPWRSHGKNTIIAPLPTQISLWDEDWRPSEHRLSALEASLKDDGAVVLRGGDFDTWDLEIRGGALGSMRTRLAIEEHGRGAQLIRIRCWPRVPVEPAIITAGLAMIALASAGDGAWIVAVTLGLLTCWLIWQAANSYAVAMSLLLRHVQSMGGAKLSEASRLTQILRKIHATGWPKAPLEDRKGAKTRVNEAQRISIRADEEFVDETGHPRKNDQSALKT